MAAQIKKVLKHDFGHLLSPEQHGDVFDRLAM